MVLCFMLVWPNPTANGPYISRRILFGLVGAVMRLVCPRLDFCTEERVLAQASILTRSAEVPKFRESFKASAVLFSEIIWKEPAKSRLRPKGCL